MEDSRYSSIFVEFKRMFPTIASTVTSGYASGLHEITVFLEDGSKLIYDRLDETIRYLAGRLTSDRTEEIWRKEVGRRLRRKMYLSGITQKELSDRTGIPQSNISKYINGQATPSSYNLIMIAEVLKCSTTELTCFD